MYDVKTVKKKAKEAIQDTMLDTVCPSSAVLGVGSTPCLQVTGCHYSDTLCIVIGSGRDHICDLSNARLLC
jgi:hypothetical protein